MSLPSVQALSLTGHPLIICARPWAKDLTEQFAAQQFIALSGKFLSDYQALEAVARSTRREALGLVLPDSFSSAALFKLSGIKSAGYRDDGRSLLLDWPIKKPTQPVHAVQKWWQLTEQALQAWRIDSPLFAHANQPAPSVTLEITEPDLQAAHSNLATHRLTPHKFVLLAPTATGTHHGKAKVWPHFSDLSQALRSQHIEVAMCPPPHERDQALRACPEAVLLDPLPLRSFCALTKLSSLVVCNDSGVSHLAAVAGAKQLTLFGVTDPANTRAWADKAALLGTNGHWPGLEEVVSTVRQMLVDPDKL